MAGSHSRALAGILAGLVLTATAGCSVQPLYGETAPLRLGGEAAPNSQFLKSVAVSNGTTRVEQAVTNRLIFLFHSGASQPETTRYELDVDVSSRTLGAAGVYTGGSKLAGRKAVLTAVYNLTDSQTGNVVASGKLTQSATFGATSQEFANVRAERDAQDRAARELAEFIRLDILAAINGNERAERVTLDEEGLLPPEIQSDLPTIEDVE